MPSGGMIETKKRDRRRALAVPLDHPRQTLEVIVAKGQHPFPKPTPRRHPR